MSDHSLFAEQSFLGALMADNSQWNNIPKWLDIHDFAFEKHKNIYEVINMLAEDKKQFDPVSVADILASQNKLDEVGGLEYLGQLVKDTPSVNDIKGYAALIREKAKMRAIIKISADLNKDMYEVIKELSAPKKKKKKIIDQFDTPDCWERQGIEVSHMLREIQEDLEWELQNIQLRIEMINDFNQLVEEGTDWNYALIDMGRENWVSYPRVVRWIDRAADHIWANLHKI